MLRSLCLILLTAFLICNATGVTRLLLAKYKSTVVCDSGTCDNEKTEVEKSSDDQLMNSTQLRFDRVYATIPLKQSFLYSVSLFSETFRILFSPPPELS